MPSRVCKHFPQHARNSLNVRYLKTESGNYRRCAIADRRDARDLGRTFARTFRSSRLCQPQSWAPPLALKPCSSIKESSLQRRQETRALGTSDFPKMTSMREGKYRGLVTAPGSFTMATKVVLCTGDPARRLLSRRDAAFSRCPPCRVRAPRRAVCGGGRQTIRTTPWARRRRRSAPSDQQNAGAPPCWCTGFRRSGSFRVALPGSP